MRRAYQHACCLRSREPKFSYLGHETLLVLLMASAIVVEMQCEFCLDLTKKIVQRRMFAYLGHWTWLVLLMASATLVVNAKQVKVKWRETICWSKGADVTSGSCG